MVGNETASDIIAEAGWPCRYTIVDGKPVALPEDDPPIALSQLLQGIGGDLAGWIAEPCAWLVPAGSEVALLDWKAEREGENAEQRVYRRARLSLFCPNQPSQLISIRFSPLNASWRLGPLMALRSKVAKHLGTSDFLDVAAEQRPLDRDADPKELPDVRHRRAFWLFCAWEREVRSGVPDGILLTRIVTELCWLAVPLKGGLANGERAKSLKDQWFAPVSRIFSEIWSDKKPPSAEALEARVQQRLADEGIEVPDGSAVFSREVRRLRTARMRAIRAAAENSET